MDRLTALRKGGIAMLPFAMLYELKQLVRPWDRKYTSSGMAISKNPGRWSLTDFPTLPSFRFEFAGACLGKYIYIIGGMTLPVIFRPTELVERYDSEKNIWERTAPLPLKAHHSRAVSVGGRIYSVGGYTLSNWFKLIPFTNTFVYDEEKDKWSEASPMPTARGAHAAAAIGDKIYVAGGATETDSPRSEARISTVEAYDTGKDTWETLEPMPTPREHVAATSVEGRLYAFGGFKDGQRTPLRANEAYDPNTNEWRKMADMPIPMCDVQAVAFGRKIYVFGGQQNWACPPELHEYDTETDSWARKADMESVRCGAFATLVKNRICIIGGCGEIGSYRYYQHTYAFVP